MFNQLQVTLAPQDPTTELDLDVGGDLSPLVPAAPVALRSPRESVNQADSSLLTIVTNQRERFRQRMQELEEVSFHLLYKIVEFED